MRHYLLISIMSLSFSSFAVETKTCVVDKARYTGLLLEYLTQSVDQCFNPAHADANKKTKQEFTGLADQVSATLVDIQKQDTARIAQDLQFLQSALKSFNDSPGFPASLYCSTRRECLEDGFSANPAYANCLPVKGNVHLNPQFLAFENLLDHAFPELLSDLRSLLEAPAK